MARWIIISIICGSTSLSATTYYVAHGGAHQSPFATWATAATNIAAAIAAADDGDRIAISNGFYAGQVALATRTLDFAGTGEKETVLGYAMFEPVFLLENGCNVGIRALTISNEYGAGIMCYDSTVRVEQCTFMRGVMEDSPNVYSNTLVTINRCLFKNNDGFFHSGGPAFHYSTGTVDNTAIFNNHSWNGAGGVWMTNSAITLRHCVLFNNWQSNEDTNITSGIYAIDSQASIINSIVWSNAVNIPAEYCCMPGGTPANGASAIGTLTNQPLLTANCHLQWNSPCINSGGELFVVPADYDNETRPQDNAPDIGMDEWLTSTGDRVPDWWKSQWGFNLGSSNIWLQDSNNDGVLNIDEYVHDRSPVNTNAIRIMGATNTRVRVWQTLTNVIEVIPGTNAVLAIRCATNNAPGSSFTTNKLYGIFVWKPQLDQMGVWSNVTYTAHDIQLAATNVTIVTVLSTNRAPHCLPISNQVIGEGQRLSFNVDATDADDDRLQFTCSNQPMPGSSLTPISNTVAVFHWTPAFDAAGTYADIFFGVADDDYRDHTYATITVTNIPRPPTDATLVINGGARYTNTANVTLTLFASNAIEMAIANDAGGTTNWTAYATSTNWTLAHASNTNIVYARFRSVWLDATTNLAAWIMVDTNPPTCTALFPPDGYVTNGGVVLSWTAADAPGGAGIAAFFLQTNSAIMITTTTAFAFAVSNKSSNSWRVMAWDGTGNTSAWTALRWFIVNHAPVILPISDKIIGEGQPLSFNVNATDPDGDQLQFTCSNQPMPGSSLASISNAVAVFRWTPAFDAAGTYPNIFFGVADDYYRDHTYATITVTNIVRPPIDATLLINDGARYTNSAGVRLTFSASNAAAMAIANDASGTTNWVAYAVNTNWNLARLSGTNTVFARFRTAWLDATTNITAWIIADTNPPTCVALFPPDGYVANGAEVLSWTATDTPGGAGIASFCLQTNSGFLSLTTSAYLFVGSTQSNYWRVMAWDFAGNTSAWTALRSLIIPEPTAVLLLALLVLRRALI